MQQPENDKDTILQFDCPHCGGQIGVAVNEINCSIFRDGVSKVTGMQLNPHAPEPECTALAASGTMYGCCNPFRIVTAINGEKTYNVEKCDYI